MVTITDQTRKLSNLLSIKIMGMQSKTPETDAPTQEIFTVSGKKLIVREEGTNISVSRGGESQVVFPGTDIVNIEIDNMQIYSGSDVENGIRGVVARKGREVMITLSKTDNAIDWITGTQRAQIEALGLIIEGLDEKDGKIKAPLGLVLKGFDEL